MLDKFIIEKFENTLPKHTLGALRTISALLYLEEGTAKVIHWPYVEKFANVHPLSLLGIAGAIDIIGAIFLLIGFITRWTAFILCGEMAFAYFMVFQPRGIFPVQNGGNDTILFCFIMLYIFVAGGGSFTLDQAIENRNARRRD